MQTCSGSKSSHRVTVSYMATEEKIDFIVEQLLESQPRVRVDAYNDCR